MTKLIICNRVDGLGERLRAMINCIAASKTLNLDFKFIWPLRKGEYQNFNVITDPEILFSKSFINKYLIKEDIYNEFKSVFDIPGNKQYSIEKLENGPLADPAITAITIQQNAIESYITDINQDIVKESFSEITFSENINDIKNTIKEFVYKNQLKFSGAHIRGGDIIYGPYKDTVFFRNKGYPASLIKKLCTDIIQSNELALVFCQDNEVEPQFNDNSKIISSKSLRKEIFDGKDENFTPLELAMSDIFLMMHCETLYGSGSSGFVGLAAKANNISIKDPKRMYPAERRVEIYGQALSKNEFPDVFQKSFCLIHMYFDSMESNNLNMRAIASNELIKTDPNSGLYKALYLFTLSDELKNQEVEDFLSQEISKENVSCIFETSIYRTLILKIAGRYHLLNFIEKFINGSTHESFPYLQQLKDGLTKILR